MARWVGKPDSTSLAAGLGVALGVVLGAGVAAVTAGGVALGKKVGRLPLCNCHWSHSITNENPKTTQRMVRRISFMVSLQSRSKRRIKECFGRSLRGAGVRDRSPRHTMGGNEISGAALENFPLPRRDGVARPRHRLNSLV